MRHKLSTQLSAGFVLIVLITVVLVSLSANMLISRRYEKSVAEEQKRFSESMADLLSPQYDSSTGTWNLDYIHGFGMYALQDGYIIKVYDQDEAIIWDAENHDMSQCHQIMLEISTRMEEERPELNGDFMTHRYVLRQSFGIVGYLDVSYYGPYYFKESDFRFLDALNSILCIVGGVAAVGAVIAGILLAKRLSAPIAKTTEITREISEGNYEMRFESEVRIKELGELAEAVNHMAESLETQEMIRRRLTSDVAHELRTPIANVSAQLEAVLEGVWEPTEERLKSCYDELGRISDIVSDLEKLRQIENTDLHLEKEQVNLLELSYAVRAAFEPELDKKGILCQIDGDGAVVSGDSKRLTQVLSNLLSNAIKYSGQGGHIRMHVEDREKEVLFYIEDDGIGIAGEDLPFIFERFYRTDASRNRKTGGAGIGLTIARAIVKAHKGRIFAESREGQGSRFTVLLPRT